jgi:hypothetical protein
MAAGPLRLPHLSTRASSLAVRPKAGAFPWAPCGRATENQKTDAVEYFEVLDRVGLLVDGPPGIAGLPFT